MDEELKKSEEQINRVIENNSHGGFFGGFKLVLRVIAYSVGTRDTVLDTEAFDEAKKDSESISEVAMIVKHIETYVKSLGVMVKFCNLVSSFFKIQSQEFERRSKSLGGTVSDECKKMTSQQCVEWIVSLNDGLFVQYEEVLLEKFMKKKKPINGQNVDQVNQLWLEYACDFEEDHAKALSDAISEKVNGSETGYLALKSDLDDNMEWMKKQRHRIQKLNEFLIKIQTETAFIPKGAVVSLDLEDFKFQTLNEVLSPAEHGNAFLSDVDLLVSQFARMYVNQAAKQQQFRPRNDSSSDRETAAIQTEKQ